MNKPKVCKNKSLEEDKGMTCDNRVRPRNMSKVSNVNFVFCFLLFLRVISFRPNKKGSF